MQRRARVKRHVFFSMHIERENHFNHVFLNNSASFKYPTHTHSLSIECVHLHNSFWATMESARASPSEQSSSSKARARTVCAYAAVKSVPGENIAARATQHPKKKKAIDSVCS